MYSVSCFNKSKYLNKHTKYLVRKKEQLLGNKSIGTKINVLTYKFFFCKSEKNNLSRHNEM